MYVRPYGKPEGLSERLDKWASDLGKNTSYPWVGLGLIADLKAAAAVIDGRPVPEDLFEEKEVPEVALTVPITEYDL